MSIKDQVNKVIKDYYRGLVSYGDAEKRIIQILHCDEGDVGVIVLENKHF